MIPSTNASCGDPAQKIKKRTLSSLLKKISLKFGKLGRYTPSQVKYLERVKTLVSNCLLFCLFIVFFYAFLIKVEFGLIKITGFYKANTIKTKILCLWQINNTVEIIFPVFLGLGRHSLSFLAGFCLFLKSRFERKCHLFSSFTKILKSRVLISQLNLQTLTLQK